MAEDKKKSFGLHKKISSIFEGVPLPQPGSPQQPPPASGGPTPESAGERAGIPQKPLPPPFQTLRVPQVPRPAETGQPPSQPAPAGPPKVNAAAKAIAGLWQQIKDKLLASKPGVSGTRQRVMLVLVPVLFVVLIFMIVSVLMSVRKATRPSRGKPSTTALASETKIDWEIPPPYPATLRDPVQPSSAAIIPGRTGPGAKEAEAVQPEKLVVKGILHSEDRPSAIIGTRIAHEGDKIYGAIIVKINKDNVEFEMDGKKWNQKVEP